MPLLIILFILFVIWLLSPSKKQTKKKSRVPQYTTVSRSYKSITGDSFIPQNELMGVDYMDGRDFEMWCAELLWYSSFTDIKVTPASSDQGVDIIAQYKGEKYAIQCKRFSNRLGNTPVQEVCAGKVFYGCDRSAVMTNNYFTKGAIQLAKATGVYLWDRDTLMELLNNKGEYLHRQTKEYKQKQKQAKREAKRNNKDTYFSCYRCGNKVNSKWQYCKNCGAPVINIEF